MHVYSLENARNKTKIRKQRKSRCPHVKKVLFSIIQFSVTKLSVSTMPKKAKSDSM